MNDFASAAPQGCDFLVSGDRPTFIPEDFTGDEALMIEAAKDFSHQEVLPAADRIDHQEEGLMPALIRKAGELGFCGPDSPEAYGGLGLSKNLSARMLEHLSLNASFSVTLGITSGIGQLGIALFGTDDQRGRYLPGLTSGEKIGAYALSEPDSGSDALSLTTRADESGAGYRLNGTKMWISNAKWADSFVVLAKVGGEKVTAFIVDRSAPGVSVAREEHKMGLKGSSTARVVLEDAAVPAENVLHGIGKGHQVAFNSLNMGRFKLASMSIGPARDAMRLAAEYAQDRKQFDRPIAEFGLIESKFAFMASMFFAAESMIYRTGHLIDLAFERHHGSPEEHVKAAEEFSVECSMVKVFATEAEALIVDEALQCFGGYGFTEEFPIARHYRDARVSRIYEGTNEVNRFSMIDRISKRLKDGRTPSEWSGGTFVGDLIAKAWPQLGDTQRAKGAMADLMILHFAEQSAEARAAVLGGVSKALLQQFRAYAFPKAAAAYQVICPSAVTVPTVGMLDAAAIAAEVYRQGGVCAFQSSRSRPS